MPSINFLEESWDKQYDDKDFLNRSKLVGQVYHMMINGALLPSVEERHMAAMELVATVANAMYACCSNCGKKLDKPTCKDCNIKKNGLLGIIN